MSFGRISGSSRLARRPPLLLVLATQSYVVFFHLGFVSMLVFSVIFRFLSYLEFAETTSHYYLPNSEERAESKLYKIQQFLHDRVLKRGEDLNENYNYILSFLSLATCALLRRIFLAVRACFYQEEPEYVPHYIGPHEQAPERETREMPEIHLPPVSENIAILKEALNKQKGEFIDLAEEKLEEGSVAAEKVKEAVVDKVSVVEEAIKKEVHAAREALEGKLDSLAMGWLGTTSDTALASCSAAVVISLLL